MTEDKLAVGNVGSVNSKQRLMDGGMCDGIQVTRARAHAGHWMDGWEACMDERAPRHDLNHIPNDCADMFSTDPLNSRFMPSWAPCACTAGPGYAQRPPYFAESPEGGLQTQSGMWDARDVAHISLITMSELHT